MKYKFNSNNCGLVINLLKFLKILRAKQKLCGVSLLSKDSSFFVNRSHQHAASKRQY